MPHFVVSRTVGKPSADTVAPRFDSGVQTVTFAPALAHGRAPAFIFGPNGLQQLGAPKRTESMAARLQRLATEPPAGVFETPEALMQSLDRA
jgi:hypothetical protein